MKFSVGCLHSNFIYVLCRSLELRYNTYLIWNTKPSYRISTKDEQSFKRIILAKVLTKLNNVKEMSYTVNHVPNVDFICIVLYVSTHEIIQHSDKGSTVFDHMLVKYWFFSHYNPNLNFLVRETLWTKLIRNFFTFEGRIVQKIFEWSLRILH